MSEKHLKNEEEKEKKKENTFSDKKIDDIFSKVKIGGTELNATSRLSTQNSFVLLVQLGLVTSDVQFFL